MKFAKSFGLVFFNTFIFFNVGCKLLKNDDQKIYHLENEFTNNDPSWVWTENSANISGMEQLPNHSPMVKRVQEMIDHLDSIARRQNPEQMAKIPRPKAVVLVDDGINAFVTGEFACVDFPVRTKKFFESENTSVLSDAESTLLFPGFKRLYPFTKEDLDCYKIENFNIKEFVKIYNNTSGGAKERQCHLELDEANQVLLFEDGSQCGFGSQTHFNRIVFYAQSNGVYVFSGLLKSFTEEAVFAVLAHELAHMYRAHSSSFKKFEPYFFKQNNDNELIRPLPTNDFMELQRSALISTQLSEWPHFESKAKINPNLLTSMYELTMTIGVWLCSEKLKKFEENCKAYSKYSHDHINEWIIKQWRDYQVIPKMNYLEFEEIFLEFLSLISNDEMKIVQNILTDSLYYNRDFFSFEFTKFKSLNEWFMHANLNIINTIKNKPVVLQRMANVNLGYYTTEEEADEIGLELAARSGLSHSQAVSPWLHFLQLETLYNGAGSETALKVEECIKMFNSEWDSQKVLLGYLNNIHHSNCYRLYNTDREWKAHEFSRFESVEENFVFSQKDVWKDLLATIAVSHSKLPEAYKEGSSPQQPDSNPSSFQFDELYKRHSCVLAPRHM